MALQIVQTRCRSCEEMMSKTLDFPSTPTNCEKAKALDGHRQSSTQHNSWFSGLRARLSQLNMSEWLNQLGIGSSNDDRKDLHKSSIDKTLETSQTDVLETKESRKDVDLLSIVNSDAGNMCASKISEYASQGDAALDLWLWGFSDYNDTIAVQHFGPLKNLITGCNHPGKGHEFLSMSVAHPTWCDKCGDFMWGFLTRAVKCENCNYTCHAKCQSLVTLNCKTADSSLNSCPDMAASAVYPNLKILNENHDIVEKDGQDEYTGFVKIHMNFTRPINVVAGDSLSFLDVTNSPGSLSTNSVRTITTFFLPRNTVKNVNISSKMTTRQMIVTLLRKFKVADNPRKFALYRRTFDSFDIDSQNCKLVRIADDSYPLNLVRMWEERNEKYQLVLQENDTGDILWDMFEIPELENFLKILNDEEKQYSFRIRQKYDAYRNCLNSNLQSRGLKIDDNEFHLHRTNSCISTDV